MFNFDSITKEDIEEHNPNWPLIVGGSGSEK